MHNQNQIAFNNCIGREQSKRNEPQRVKKIAGRWTTNIEIFESCGVENAQSEEYQPKAETKLAGWKGGLIGSLVWSYLAIVCNPPFVPKNHPPAWARQKQQSQKAREEAQGSATDGFFLYIGAPFPARGARREAEIGAGGLVVSTLGGFWACGPRSPPAWAHSKINTLSNNSLRTYRSMANFHPHSRSSNGI